MTNMIRVLMVKVDNMQEMSNGVISILRKKQKKILEIQISVAEMISSFLCNIRLLKSVKQLTMENSGASQ